MIVSSQDFNAELFVGDGPCGTGAFGYQRGGVLDLRTVGPAFESEAGVGSREVDGRAADEADATVRATERNRGVRINRGIARLTQRRVAVSAVSSRDIIVGHISAR